MQIPYRKPGKFGLQKPDPLMTAAKLVELEQKLQAALHARPAAATEVARLAELGDFSENAEYQLAKGKLRGINNTILRLRSEINNAVIITSNNSSGSVEIGSTVIIELRGKKQEFQILGSSETNPEKGVISYSSPLGKALLGASIGDEVCVELRNSKNNYTVIAIQ